MTAGTLHPSFLQLDRCCVGLETDLAALSHVKECERCRSYVESYQPATEIPSWVIDTTSAPPARPQRNASRRGWASGVIALAAAACLVLWLPRFEDTSYDGAKGAPSIGVHVQRDGVASLWDGSPLSPGDRIRLEVMPEEFDHVSVFSMSAGRASPQRLYAGRIVPRVPTLLPKAWQLDDAPGAEQLLVILARAEVSPEAATAILRAHDPREVWWVRLPLPKQSVQP